MLQKCLSLLRWDIWGALPEISTAWIALLSGLLGAVITAIFNYFINIKLAKREQKRKEQRMAYVYLVKVSDIVAIDLMLRKIISRELKKLDPNNVFQGFIKSISEKLNMPHAACTLIAKALNDTDSDPIKKIRDSLQSLSQSEYDFPEVMGFQLPDEMLVQLPRESVIHYSSFIKNIFAIRQAYNLWLHWAKTGERDLLKANILYSHWSTIKDISTNARKLRFILIEKGRVSHDEAENLLSLQETKLTEGVKDLLYAGKVMEVMGEMFKKMGIGENITGASPNPLPSPAKTEKAGR